MTRQVERCHGAPTCRECRLVLGPVLEATAEAKESLAEHGYDPQYGARPLRRVIQQMVEDPLSEGVLAGKFREGMCVIIDVADGEIVLEPGAEEPEVEAPETLSQ